MIRKKITIISGIIIVALFAITAVVPKGYFTQKQFQFERITKKTFYFTQNQLASVINVSQTHIKLPLTFFKQEHSVSCEVAALHSALDYYGIKVAEDELISKLNFSTKAPRSAENIWGDPNVGFVGDIDGSIFLGTGYGVYEKPIRDLAIKYTGAFVMEEATLDKVLKEVENGRPVLVWGLLSNRKHIYWKTKEGKTMEAFPGEHVRVVMGYTGDISSPDKIILMDSIYGRIFMKKDKFIRDWGTLRNRTVVIFDTPQTKKESDIIIESLKEQILIFQKKIKMLEYLQD